MNKNCQEIHLERSYFINPQSIRLKIVIQLKLIGAPTMYQTLWNLRHKFFLENLFLPPSLKRSEQNGHYFRGRNFENSI